MVALPLLFLSAGMIARTRLPGRGAALSPRATPLRACPPHASALAFEEDEDDVLESLSAGELKLKLIERDVDFRDCLDRADLLQRLRDNIDLPALPLPELYRLTAGEERLVSVFQHCSPAVAYIRTFNSPPSLGFQISGIEYPSGSGSGFLWDSEGHIVTNYHVIASRSSGVPPKVKVMLQGASEQVEARVIDYEEECDIAVLKIELESLPRPVAVGSSALLKVGQTVLAIGNPFGLDYTLTTGVLSAVDRDVRAERGVIKSCLQIDAAINPGNSGGPLLDSSGRLIGVNTAIYSTKGGGNIGIGFAIPVDTVRQVVNQIIRQSTMPRLGANVYEDSITRSIGRRFGLQLEGALVRDVVPAGPAEAVDLTPARRGALGGLVLGDLIIAVDDIPVQRVEDLTSAILERRPGDTVVLTVRSGPGMSQEKLLSVPLISRDELKKRRSEKKKAEMRLGPQ